MLDFGTAVFLFIYRTFVHFYVDTERTFCYIIKKNKCLRRIGDGEEGKNSFCVSGMRI